MIEKSAIILTIASLLIYILIIPAFNRYVIGQEKPAFDIPIEMREQLMTNQKKYNVYKAAMVRAEMRNKQILEEILVLNNITRFPNEQWFLKMEGNEWSLFKKNK